MEIRNTFLFQRNKKEQNPMMKLEHIQIVDDDFENGNTRKKKEDDEEKERINNKNKNKRER